jgi:uncharacterized OB-fold protein
MSETPAKPLPSMQDLNGEFHKHCARGELRFQRCDDCAAWRHPPRVLCARCGSPLASWQPVSGRGRIFTWTVTHQPLHPAFAHDVPYATVVTELEEGIRLVSGTRDLPLTTLRLDLPVQVILEDASDDLKLPYVRPR